MKLDSRGQDYSPHVPADCIGEGANLSFADGHAEHWKWKAPKKGRAVGSHTASSEDLMDLRRLQQHIKGASGN